MRSGILLAAASLALLLEGGCAGAQGVGTPPMVDPLPGVDPDRPPDSGAEMPPALMPDPALQGLPPGNAPPAPAFAGPPLDVDRVMDGVKKCWTAIPRVYGTEAQGGVARIRLKFQPNGTLDGPPMIIDKPLGAIGAKFATSAAEAIQRCQPYALPPERYAEWRQIEMRFDTIDPDNPPPPAPPAVTAPPEASALAVPDGALPGETAPGAVVPADPAVAPQ